LPQWPQQFLDFLPLPHGQGSLRPTFFSAIIGFSGFNNRFRSLTSSGFSGSNSIRYFQPCFSNNDVASLYRASDCTLTPAGFLAVPNRAGFLAPNLFFRLSAPTLLLIAPISEILFPIILLFQLLFDLAIEAISQAHRSPRFPRRSSLFISHLRGKRATGMMQQASHFFAPIWPHFRYYCPVTPREEPRTRSCG
jgi:hypothetical protein